MDNEFATLISSALQRVEQKQDRTDDKLDTIMERLREHEHPALDKRMSRIERYSTAVGKKLVAALIAAVLAAAKIQGNL